MITPAGIAKSLTHARTAWGLSQHQLAQRAGVSDRDVQTAEKGGAAEVETLAALARSLGGSLADLLAGRAFWSAPALAFKSTPGKVDPSVIWRGLTRASSAAQEHGALGRFLGLPDLWKDRGAKLGPVGLRGSPTKQAEELATRVLAAIASPVAPLASVRAVMGQLGVSTFLTEFASDDVDGAMWRLEGDAPSVVANASARDGLVTALRMTFAHELCHALFDRPRHGDQGLVETRTPRGEGLEQRANAFAAHLLAPRKAVAQFLSELGVSKESGPGSQHLLALSITFGIGVEAGAWHLVNCGYWSEAMVRENRGLLSPQFARGDARELEPTPGETLVSLERRGALLDRATAALDQGKVSVARWREILGLTAQREWRRLLGERQVVLDTEHHLAKSA